ncbi:MAG: site-2 protease family protein, partial [bacterium]|nr:site-2 protease family protein [bacterium]
FNLIPIPPLDGSKIFAQLLPHNLAIAYERARAMLEHNIFLAFGIVIIFILVFGGQFAALIGAITRFIVG